MEYKTAQQEKEKKKTGTNLIYSKEPGKKHRLYDSLYEILYIVT